MATEIKSKGIIYCTKEQFDTLMSTGSVVIGGVTYTYEDGWQFAVVGTDYMQLVSAPASATASGTAGQIAYDSEYIYVCVAANTWVRAALSTW